MSDILKEIKRRKKLVKQLNKEKVYNAFKGYEEWKLCENFESGVEYALDVILKEIENKFGKIDKE